MKIGFFDSGIGGYTILSAVRKKFPGYEYVYYGDTAHVPYGDRTEDEVYALTKQGVHTLFAHGAILVIIACNTASAETLRRLQDELIPAVYTGRKILGVIIPTVETIFESGTHDVLLIGTRRTVESKKYERELAFRNFPSAITSVATPQLVPLLESFDYPKAMAYLDSVISERVGHADTLVLACTHYVLLKEHIRKRYPGVRVLAQDEIIPEKIDTYLKAHPELQSELGTQGTLELILTKDDATYREALGHLIDV